jgi:hypothetical protein
MSVQVDEAGQDEKTGGVQDPRSARLESGADLRHEAVLQQEIEVALQSGDRVYQPASAHEHGPVHAASPSQACPVSRR